MGGQKFQYDESGGTFFYFLLSFLALILLPGTYFVFPRAKKEDPNKLGGQCNCIPCKTKREILTTKKSWKGPLIARGLLIAGWVFFAFLAYRVSEFEYEMANFDPYDILGVPFEASTAEVKRAYRQLSLIYHPDKETGNEKHFMKLTKAYKALTDEESMRNWHKYGNPDGPGAMSFGIALPASIVEKGNSFYVLAVYALVFMVVLPTAVGIWWYSSMRYSGDQVLLDTTQLYYYMFHKTPSMPLKRVIMVLAASSEFDKRHNKEIKERPTDNIEVPKLIGQLPQLNEKNKEAPLCLAYSLKARALLHAHLSRLPLNPDTLEKDRQMVVAKCPALIQEMVSCTSQLVLLAYAGRISASKLLRIDTIENVMKLSPMVVQGLWDYKSPLLQLPHVTEESLKYFTSKKRHIKTIQQFAQLKAEERRAILKQLTDDEFDDVMNVIASMPYIEFEVDSEVVDDEQTKVYTAGAIVTVTIMLVRKSMKELLGDETVNVNTLGDAEETVPEDKKEEKQVTLKPKWQKQNKKQKPAKKKKVRNTMKSTEAKSEVTANGTVVGPDTPKSNTSTSHTQAVAHDNSESDSDSPVTDDEKSDDENDDKEEVADDDQEWEKFQRKDDKIDKILDTNGKVSHPVHCPLYSMEKQEYWWVYICDRKNMSLLTAPYHVTNLKDEQKVKLKFTAPKWPGKYTFTVCLRSDSYLGASQTHDLKLDVQEAPAPLVEHPQWENVSDNEEKKSDQSDLSEYTTDEDVADD